MLVLVSMLILMLMLMLMLILMLMLVSMLMLMLMLMLGLMLMFSWWFFLQSGDLDVFIGLFQDMRSVPHLEWLFLLIRAKGDCYIGPIIKELKQNWTKFLRSAISAEWAPCLRRRPIWRYKFPLQWTKLEQIGHFVKGDKELKCLIN